MEKQWQSQPFGHDMASAIQSVLGSEVATGKIETHELVFVEREVKGGGQQKFAVIDSAGGIEVYPLLSRFDPRLGKKYTCHVIFKKDEKRLGGKLGFALPVSLLKLKADEWMPPSANVLRHVLFHKSDGKGGAQYVGRPMKGGGQRLNGKVVVVFGDYEPPTDKPVDVLVAERVSCFAVAGEVKAEQPGQIGTMGALVLAAETAETILGSVDPFMVLHGGTYFDAAQVLGVSKAASARDIKKTAQKKLQENHPDTKIGGFRKQFGCDPDPRTVAEWEDDNMLLGACRDKMMVYGKRRDAEAEYGPAGKKFKKPMRLDRLAHNLICTLEEAIAAAKECGYEVKEDTLIGQGLCGVLSGYFARKAAKCAPGDNDKPAEPAPAASV